MTKIVRPAALLLCLLLLLGVAAPVVAEDAGEVSVSIYSTAVRYSPGGRCIGYLEEDRAVTVLGETGEYYKIDGYGLNGYVRKEQLSEKSDGKFYVNCDAESGDTRVTEQMVRSQAEQFRQSLMELGETCVGVHYSKGGTSKRGFDCSGLTQYLYADNGMEIHRVVADQLEDGYIVAKEDLEVGDLLFFRIQGGSIASHVGIYAGDGKFLHASNRGVVIDDLDMPYYVRYYLCARRVITEPSAVIERSAVAEVMTAASLLGNQ